jgi:hypothetical protein
VDQWALVVGDFLHSSKFWLTGSLVKDKFDGMKRQPIDRNWEHRIEMEIVVDAYNESERAMGWYCHLENVLKIPFQARCISTKAASPLRVGEEIEVVGLADSEDCAHEVKVTIRWKDAPLAVPLSQIEGVKTTAMIQQAISDWHYWIARGYEY